MLVIVMFKQILFERNRLGGQKYISLCNVYCFMEFVVVAVDTHSLSVAMLLFCDSCFICIEKAAVIFSGEMTYQKVEGRPLLLELPCFQAFCGAGQLCGQHQYRLKAIIVHIGKSLNEGHYISFVRLPDQAQTKKRAATALFMNDNDEAPAAKVAKADHINITPSTTMTHSPRLPRLIPTPPLSTSPLQNRASRHHVTSPFSHALTQAAAADNMNKGRREDSIWWREFDDDKVTRISQEQLAAKIDHEEDFAPYLLFYQLDN